MFGPYDILEPLGSGGMASVFKARERTLDRHVALKTLPQDSLRLSNFAERFEREAKIVARLEHPNIVPIFGYGITEGVPWMAMRFIAGGSVARRIRGGVLEPQQVARIVRDVADALDYAHERSILHRDVKPQNMLLDESGRAYLTDFGIARIMAGHPRLTGVGSVAGTPEYMAPEQATGAEPDLRLDVYALGTVAYQMLTGRTPFGGDAPLAVLKRQVSAPVPAEPLAALSPELREVVLRCLAKNPSERWNRAGAFATAFDAAVRSPLGDTPAPGPARSVPRSPLAGPAASPPPVRGDEPTLVVTGASRPTMPGGPEISVVAAAAMPAPVPRKAESSSPPWPASGPGYDPTLVPQKAAVQAPPPRSPALTRPPTTGATARPTRAPATLVPPPVSGPRPGLTAAHIAIIALTALFGLGLLGLTSYLVLHTARSAPSVSSPAPLPPAR